MTDRYDFDRVHAGLKDFQRDTVEYVFRRMYVDEPSTKRFLVADEVGLGKTLVARGLIARAIEHQWDDIDRIDVVYICSNADIARQNIRRLNVTDQTEFAFAHRLTLMALEMKSLSKNKVNFVSFTPGTSFDLKDAMGWSKERAMLFWLMQRVWGDDVIKRGRKGDQRVFQGWSELRNFQRQLSHIEPEVSLIDGSVMRSFRRVLKESERTRRAEKQPALRARYDDIRGRFTYDLKNRPDQDWRDRSRFIGELRNLLARSIVDALEPDLIILDEFQRFKHLLDGDTDAARLAHELFDYSDAQATARVLLLSATPYKMFTLAEESEEDDHYADFLRTTGFLLENDTATFERDLKEFRHALMRLSGDPDSIGRTIKAKNRVQRRLSKVMARTERLAVGNDRDGMLSQQEPFDSHLEPTDLLGYVALDRFANVIEGDGRVEYWKSVPYFPNFMDGYQLGRQFEKAQSNPETLEQARAALDGHCVIDWDKVASFKPLDAANARLRGVIEQMLDTDAWKLLWMPPTLPYYEPGPPYNTPQAQSLTKRLIFSAWNAVPRSVASIMSYEAERRIMAKTGRTNTPGARAKLTELLKFTEAKGRLTGMPVLGLLYPSPSLADIGDPLRLATQLGGATGPVPVQELRREVKRAIRDALRDFPDEREGREDDRWYWAAPLLLDQRQEQAGWIERPQVVQAWTGEGAQGFTQHVEEARGILRSHPGLGRRPEDLEEVLVSMAIGGPANTALRALRLITPPGTDNDETRDAAARIAWEFRSLFNLPETRYVVRPITRGTMPYWRKVLRYCVNGNLQAVLDEYVHVLREWLGILDPSAAGAAGSVGEALADAVSLRSVNYYVRDPMLPWDEGRVTIRSRFALQFGQRQTDEEGHLQRSGLVRGAFNSPFWPFVLVSTSVGQEGLDFHLYCHAIVHWNLPSNPVDLEQREGRVHRYKGHAIRRNLVERHRSAAFEDSTGDPWDRMFDAAKAARDKAANDLVPYWTLPGTSVIQRHVPATPLSREVPRLENLKRTMAVYRLVFGQPRQEDLLAYLLQRGIDTTDVEDLVGRLSVDLSPPARKR